MRAQFSAAALAAVFVLSACSSPSSPMPGSPAPPSTAGMSQRQSSTLAVKPSSDASVLAMLDDEKTVGSVVDPVTGDVNPYGLEVAPVTNGKITAGDLVVCDFNDKANVQGTGTAIVTIHPAIGSKPIHVFNGPLLEGCNALALAPDDTIWTADFTANDAPIITPTGHLVTAEKNGPWNGPFGEAFVPPVNAKSPPAFYVTNAGNGDLVRIAIGNTITFTVIAKGFPINHGVPGSILGPSGLTYDPSCDRMYVVDGQNNALYAIDYISNVGANGITVHGLTFSGPSASDAHVIYHGAPLNGPISSALLPGGHIVLGNTLDPTGKNLMVEITPSGHEVFVKNVDKGAAGAIFGMAATGDSTGNVKLYFNDDNSNALVVLQH